MKWDSSSAGSGVAVIVVAAGKGLRAGGEVPKQYQRVAGETVLTRTLKAFCDHPDVTQVLTVIGPDHDALYAAAAPSSAKLLPPVKGGASRADSVFQGMQQLEAQERPACVLIHDGARPFVSRDVIDRVIGALGAHDGAVAMVPVVDSMRRVGETGALQDVVPRESVQRAQTPQGFRFDALYESFLSAQKDDTLQSHTDDASIAMASGLDVVAVAGDAMNFKLTTPEDFAMAERLLGLPDIRHGQGFDVHAFAEGEHVILCGVKVPHDKTLSGHSDADVGLHALTDAILGGAAAGDIGRHFPPSDPQWKGMDSAHFLRHAVEIVGDMGFALSNVDVTLICERPKITPHAPAMRGRVADLCGLDLSRVSVKATTTERLGFCGREEGIAAMASATLIRAEHSA